MADLRLFIVAADPLARTGLSTVISGLAEFHIVGQAGPEERLLLEIDTMKPDVIIWDLGWEQEGQMDYLLELSADNQIGAPGIVALLPDEEDANDLWSVGVRALLLRDASIEVLQSAILAAAHGLAIIDPSLLIDLPLAGSFQDKSQIEDLTVREIEVLELVAEGLSNKAIAQKLEISEHTVKFHLNALMGKLSAQSRTAAVVQATRLGLISL